MPKIEQDLLKVKGSDGLVSYVINKSYSTYPYVTYFDGESRIWKVISAAYPSSMSYFDISFKNGTITTSNMESRGETTGRFMVSNNANEYPVNGVQGGYWYLRTQIGYTK